MIVSLVVAISANRAIGNKGMLPWKRVPADAAHMKELAAGKTLIMGSETARSMIRYKSPLMQECPVVILTRRSVHEFADEGYWTALSLEEALKTAEDEGAAEACIFGGGQIYAEALSQKAVDLIHLTLIHTTVEGDTFFPDLPEGEWKEAAREDHPADDKNPYDYTFLTYERVPAGSPASVS
jgi:dihydrofolate reductase